RLHLRLLLMTSWTCVKNHHSQAIQVSNSYHPLYQCPSHCLHQPLSKAGYCPTPPLSVFYNSLTLSLCLCFYLYYRCFCFFSIPDGNLPREVFCQARKGIGSHSLC